MIIIYHCWGGAHSSVTAASIHLGMLPMDRTPTKEEFLNMQYFDRQNPHDHGKVVCLGIDERGHQVCFMGRRSYGEIVMRAIKEVGRVCQIDPGQIFFADAMPCTNFVMMLGGSVSRALRLIAIGRPVVIHGTQQCYCRLVQLVKNVKQKIGPALEE